MADKDDNFEKVKPQKKDKYEEQVKNFSVKHDDINRERGCNDLLCLIIFFIFIGSMGYLTFYGYQNGNV